VSDTSGYAPITGAAFAVLLALGSVGCRSSPDNPAIDTAAVAATAEIVDATAGASGIEFDVTIESSNAVVLSATGVLDVATLAGYRTDSADLEGRDPQPIALVWLEGGELYEADVDTGAPATPIDGGLADFLGLNDLAAPYTLVALLGDWLGSGDQQVVGRETIDGVPVAHLAIDPSPERSLDVWIDSASRLVRVDEEVGAAQSPTTVISHRFTYPEQPVSIPPRP